MADTTSGVLQTNPEYITEPGAYKRSPFWSRLALGMIMVIAVFMDFFQLGQNGFATYYGASVRSMLDSWHNFFFVSYDPGGFVTIDKPPLGFWLQVISARIFGFTPFSVLLPQALAGVFSVLVLYYLVRRHFGVVAGLLAALALAISPISVVTNRNITIDSTLALTLLLGAWAVLRAAETGRLRWLLLCATLVGLGFNIKMLEAYLVVPAFGLLYLLAAPRSVWVRIGHLALAGLLLLAVSLSWAVAVDLTPTSQRPYVGSSQDNSELSLAFGYNGIDRLLGQFGRGQRTTAPGQANTRNGNGGAPTGTPTTGANGTNGTNRATGANGANRGGGTRTQQTPAGFGGVFESGAPGPLRLFNQPLGGQIAWLLPLALLGALALAWQRRPRLQVDRQQQSLVLWGAWLLTMGIFFSVASFFHDYYMTEMAPAICALFGIGLVIMWRDYRRPGWRGWLLPLALLVTVAEQVHILTNYPTWGQWLIPLITVPCAVAVLVLIIARVVPRIRDGASSIRFLVPALSVGVLSLLIATTVWAVVPIIQNTTAQAETPSAGPGARNGFGGGGNFGGGGGTTTDAALIRYLEANQGNAKFLVATPSSMTADGIILATNRPVMALGGFGGSDPILTTSQLTTLVANGTVRFFLLNAPRTARQLSPQTLEQIPEQYRNFLRNGGGGGFGGGQQSALTTWVTQHCTAVPPGLWQSAATGSRASNVLYSCVKTH